MTEPTREQVLGLAKEHEMLSAGHRGLNDICDMIADDQATIARALRLLAEMMGREADGWLPTAAAEWLANYEGSACARETAVHNRPIKTDGGVPFYFAAPAERKSEEEFYLLTREKIAALRENHRRQMNAAAERAAMAASIGDMKEVSINSTESERHREAFVALNVAIDILDIHEPAPPAPGYAEGLEAARNVGGQMANVMFNLAQDERLTETQRACMRSLCGQWDAAIRALKEG